MPARSTPITRQVPSPTWSSSSLGKHTAHTLSNSLTEEDADWIVRRTELRVSQVIAKSKYVQTHCRLNELPRFSHDELVVGDIIASGGFSNVHRIEAFGVHTELAFGENCKKNYVVKHLNPRLANDPKKMAVGAKDLVMEAHFLSSLDHEHIIELRGMCSAGVAGYAETGRAEGFFLIFDQLAATLSHRLNDWKHMEVNGKPRSNGKPFFPFSRKSVGKNMVTFQDRIKTAHDIADAVAYLHERGILYRDLKPGNCGYDVDGTLKIFDFGLAVELPQSDDPNQLYNLAGNTGTARYMAVEVIKNKPYNFKADVFSFTTLFWEILALKKPFNELSGQEVKEWVAELGHRPAIARCWPSGVRKLMKAGWLVEIEARPTMIEVRDTLASLLE
jgi:serine/threonine protein kinase